MAVILQVQKFITKSSVPLKLCKIRSELLLPDSNSNAISVGAKTQNYKRESFFNYGQHLFISAPDLQIKSTDLGNTLKNLSPNKINHILDLIIKRGAVDFMKKDDQVLQNQNLTNQITHLMN